MKPLLLILVGMLTTRSLRIGVHFININKQFQLSRFSDSSIPASATRLHAASTDTITSDSETIKTEKLIRKSLLTTVRSRLAKRSVGEVVGNTEETKSSPIFVTSKEGDIVETVYFPDDSESPIVNDFSRLGLINEIVKGVAAQEFSTPTPVQKVVIPRLIAGENLVMAASTGSGKTLAFTLPVIQDLISQETAGYKRQNQRPRCLVLVPTRDLARQILTSIKSISHFAKMSSAAVLGGESYAAQKESLNRMVDIVVASPGRLMQHKEKSNVYFSHVTHVVIDEVDTMLTQGFGPDIRAILRATLNKHADNSNLTQTSNPAQVIMATATLTKAVKELLNDVNGNFNIEFSDSTNKTPKKLNGTETAVHMNIVEVDGVHRTLPHVQHLVEDTKGEDKLVVLKTVLERFKTKKFPTLVFCNTVAACRAVEYSLNETEFNVLSYHGDLNSKERADNLQRFRGGEIQYLICSDIAARGLDIPDIGHVIMFDFPLNPVDYIHRAGRCGRAGRKGIVTALITKRDKVLSDAIQGAIARGLPIDNLSSSKRDYTDKGKLGAVIGRTKPKPKPAFKASASMSRPAVGGRANRGLKVDKSSKEDETKGRSKGGAGYKLPYEKPFLGTSKGGSKSYLSGADKRKKLG